MLIGERQLLGNVMAMTLAAQATFITLKIKKEYGYNNPNKMKKELNKTFLICDDNSPKYYIGQFSRTNSELKPNSILRTLKVGSITSEDCKKGIHLMRER